tara:strand:- start:1537 stop:1737 length:201 start_codon:yes stop_codon:yes gene_type:complete
MQELNKYVKEELKRLDVMLVSTPEDRNQLESFASGNMGSNDVVLMQMAIQYGYKLAMQNIQEEFNK